MNWRFWRKQYRVSILENNYNYKIVKLMNAEGKLDVPLFDYIKQEFNAKQKWSWKTKENFLVFDNEQDFAMFLLRMM
jgi:hypothetical protein